MIFLVLLIFSFSIASPLNDPKCGRLSNGCELKSYYCDNYENFTICNMFVCDRIDLNFQFDETEMDLISNCYYNSSEVRDAINNVYFQLSKPSILDGSFDLLNNDNFLSSNESRIMNNDDDNLYTKLTFRYVKGFEVGLFNYRNNTIRIDFYYSNLDFYINQSLIRSCEDIENLSEYPKYIFDSLSASYDNCYNEFRFYNCEYKTKICPLIIGRNMALNKFAYLKFIGIQNTFHKSNFPRFQPISNSSSNDNITFLSLKLLNMQNIELNSDILNEYLFSKIIVLGLFGDIVSIQKGLLKSFKGLNHIEIDPLSIRKLMHHGIDWIFDLNSDINVDIYNHSLASDIIEVEICVNIDITSSHDQGVDIGKLNYNDIFPDEDFCLYARIPIQQLIFIYFKTYGIEEKDYSCTSLWILRNMRISFDFCNWLREYDLPTIDNSTKFDECNFNKRLIFNILNKIKKII